MASDFSRTLALLRREKKISQRTAAGDLGVSQALLSHYENGLREPGLSFVVRAADYYGVSCDYLLGRSMARDGSAVPAERMDISVGSEQEKSQILNAAALLLELAEATGSEQLPHEIEAYLAIAIYKVYRYLYLADPGSIEAVFRAPHDCFDYLCDARAREHELRRARRSRLRHHRRGASAFLALPCRDQRALSVPVERPSDRAPAGLGLHRGSREKFFPGK